MEGSADTSWDVDKYKSDYEPKHHWELRRQFLVANKGRFSEDKLVCLAQTFANIEFMGCRYPKATMDLVEELAYGIVQEYREGQQNRLKRTFVSGSEAAGSKVNKRGEKRKSEAGEGSARKNFKYSDFVSASPAPPSAGFDPRSDAFTPKRTPNIRSSSCPDDFILVRLDYEKSESACNVFNRSAGLCKISVSWDTVKVGNDDKWRCDVRLRDTIVHSSEGPSKAEARDTALSSALADLSAKCYTVVVKSKFLSSDGSSVDVEELSSGSGSGNAPLSSSNVGHKLLKLMGWSGGGLGRGGAGISEPVTATAICNREGLGSKSEKMFRDRVKKLITEYAASSNPYDLVFSTGFTNEQRKEMHLIAKRLGLKSKSFGKDDERFLTISRKFDAAQLIDELVRRGGSTEKYELLPPGTPF